MSDHPTLLSPSDRVAVAGRLRGLFGAEVEQLGRLARRLEVAESALHASVAHASPRPSLDVLIATVRHFGVDPHWLVTGEYDTAVHRLAVDGDDVAAAEVVNDLVRRRNTPPGVLMPRLLPIDDPPPPPRPEA